ncbi:MAG: alpha-ketoglutarate-dependent dioxygenase AlkB [Pseudomonadota bacterium]
MRFRFHIPSGLSRRRPVRGLVDCIFSCRTAAWSLPLFRRRSVYMKGVEGLQGEWGKILPTFLPHLNRVGAERTSMAKRPKPLPESVFHRPAFYSREAQEALLADIRAGVAAAPLFTPTMPRTAKPLSVRMTNFGPLGWVTDKDNGYRYQPRHPVTGEPWPPIPDELQRLWRDLFPGEPEPQACLVNFYTGAVRLVSSRS